MSAANSAREAEAAAAYFEAEILRLGAEHQEQVQLRTSALIRRAQGSDEPGLSHQIENNAAKIASLDSEIVGATEALRQVREILPELAKREGDALAEVAMAKAKINAIAVRKAAKAVDEAADSLGSASAALREALATLSNEADTSVRAAEGFDMLPYFVGNLAATVQARLSHLGVLSGRSFLIDRSVAAPSVREQIDRAIFGVLPLQGRPKTATTA